MESQLNDNIADVDIQNRSGAEAEVEDKLIVVEEKEENPQALITTVKDEKLNLIKICDYCKKLNSKDGIILSCKHSYCRNCLIFPLAKYYNQFNNLIDLLSKSSLEITCIICSLGKLTIYSSNILTMLSSEINLNYENKERNVEEIVPPCEACEENPYKYWCEKCNTYFCIPCLENIHNKSKKTMKHEVIDITLDNKNLDFCMDCIKKNQGIKAKRGLYFCMNCEYEVCADCGEYYNDDQDSNKHSSHQLCNIKDLHYTLKEQVKYNCSGVDLCNEQQEEINKTIQQVKENQSLMVKQINRIIKRMIKIKSELEKEILIENKVFTNNIQILGLTHEKFNKELENEDHLDINKLLKIHKQVLFNPLNNDVSFQTLNDTWNNFYLKQILIKLEQLEEEILSKVSIDGLGLLNCSTSINLFVSESRSLNFDDKLDSSQQGSIYNCNLLNEALGDKNEYRLDQTSKFNSKVDERSLHNDSIKFTEGKKSIDKDIYVNDFMVSFKKQAKDQTYRNEKDKLSFTLKGTPKNNDKFPLTVSTKYMSIKNPTSNNIIIDAFDTFQSSLKENIYDTNKNFAFTSEPHSEADIQFAIKTNVENINDDQFYETYKKDYINYQDVLESQISEEGDLDKMANNLLEGNSNTFEDKTHIMINNKDIEENKNDLEQNSNHENIYLRDNIKLNISRIYSDKAIQEPSEIKSNLIEITKFKGQRFLLVPNKQYNLEVFLLIDSSQETVFLQRIETEFIGRISEVKSFTRDDKFYFLLSSSSGIAKVFKFDYLEKTYELITVINNETPISSSEYLLTNNGKEKREIIICGSNQLNKPLKLYNINGEKLKNINLLKNSSVNQVLALCIYNKDTTQGFFNFAFIGEKKNLSVYDIDYGKLFKNFKTNEMISSIKIFGSFLIYSDISGMIYSREIFNWQKYSTLSFEPSIIYDFCFNKEIIFACTNSDEIFLLVIENKELLYKSKLKLSNYKEESVSESVDKLDSLVACYRSNIEIFNIFSDMESCQSTIYCYCSNKSIVQLKPN